MIFEKNLNLKIVFIFLSGIIHFITASDCDIAKKISMYIKIENDVLDQSNSCYGINNFQINCNSSNQIGIM